MAKRRSRKTNAFTLVEILITISIIGILAAIVLPRFFGHAERSRSTEATNMMGAIRQAEEAYRNGPAGIYLAIDQDDSGDNACTDALNNNAWQRIGMGDPNLNANSYFTYCIFTPAAGQFQIVATRTALAAAAADAGTQIVLDQDGLWSGDYSQLPENPI